MIILVARNEEGEMARTSTVLEDQIEQNPGGTSDDQASKHLAPPTAKSPDHRRASSPTQSTAINQRRAKSPTSPPQNAPYQQHQAQPHNLDSIFHNINQYLPQTHSKTLTKSPPRQRKSHSCIRPSILQSYIPTLINHI